MIKFLKNNLFLILVVALSFPAAFALFHKGFYGASDDLHIAWLFEMDKLFKMWQIPPRFVPDLSYGFGYPLFNFVFPFPFYLGEVLHLFGLSLVDSVKTVFGISLVGSAVAMFLFLSEIISPELSLIGSLIYVYTPYRSTDVYVRGAFGEALSFVFLPFAMYGIIKIFKNNSWRSVSAFSLSLALLVLTHDIVSYMFFPFLILFIVMLYFISPNRKDFILKSLAGIVLGLIASIYFWFPAIKDSNLMVYGTVFNYLDHFPTINQLITPYFGYGASVPGPYDGMSFYIGTMNWVLVISGLILAFLNWKKISQVSKNIFLWSGVVFIIAFFMMNFRSSFLWDHLPYLPYFQFPWRFLTLTTLSSVIFIIPLDCLNNKFIKYLTVGILVIATIGINIGFFKPHDFLERTDAYYLNRYVPNPVASKEYEQTQEEYLRLPKGSEKRPAKNYPLIFSDKDIAYDVLYTNGIDSKIKIKSSHELNISYSKYYFPGWVAKIDSKETNIQIAKPFAQISIIVPSGEHIVEFTFAETLRNKILDIISICGFLVILI